MKRKIWVVGEGTFADRVLEQIEVNASLIRKSIADLREVDDQQHPHGILSLLDYRGIEEELEIQRIARRLQVPYLRAHLYTDRAYIGPWVMPEKEGCIRCAEYRMRTAHPHRDMEEGMVKAQKSVRYLKAKKCWSIPFLSFCSVLIEGELQQWISGGPCN